MTPRSQRQIDRKRDDDGLRPDAVAACFDAVPLGVLVLNHQGKVVYANQAAANLFNISTGQLLNESFPERFGSRFSAHALGDIAALQDVAGQGAAGHTLLSRYAHADLPHLEFRITVMAAPAAGPGAIMLMMQDVTLDQRRQWQEERRLRLRSLERLSGRVAHKIRNPLGSIELYASLMQEKDSLDGPTVQRYGTKISESVHAVELIITNMLWFTKQLKPILSSLDMHRQLKEVIFFINQVARRQGIEMEVSLNATQPEILADQELINQMLLNVFQNCVQAQPDGGRIIVETADVFPPMQQASGLEPSAHAARREVREGSPGNALGEERKARATQNGAMLEVRVRDAGPGIPDDELSDVFSPFFSTKPGMAGLGLSIVQNIVEAHGGTVCAMNDAPHGCLISMMLPHQASHDEPEIGARVPATLAALDDRTEDTCS